jgi:LPXTG-motif cell wall-anchored protein
MRNILTTTILWLFTITPASLLADMPGKRSMADSKVTFQGLTNLKGYQFHWYAEYGGDAHVVNGDTTLIVPSSGGSPAEAYLWAVNKTTGEVTDSIPFSNYYDPDYIVVVKAIEGRKLSYTSRKLTNANAKGEEDKADFSDVKDKSLVEHARQAAKASNTDTKSLLYIGVPVVALGLLAFVFIRRKRK